MLFVSDFSTHVTPFNHFHHWLTTWIPTSKLPIFPWGGMLTYHIKWTCYKSLALHKFFSWDSDWQVLTVILSLTCFRDSAQVSALQRQQSDISHRWKLPVLVLSWEVRLIPRENMKHIDSLNQNIYDNRVRNSKHKRTVTTHEHCENPSLHGKSVTLTAAPHPI